MEAISTIQEATSVDALWKGYLETRDDQVREKLILQYIPLVKHVIMRMFSHLPAHVSRDDLMSIGVLGLMTAIERYKADRQVKFETFAIPRIRGAILDELRSYDLVPRSVRGKMRKVQRVIRELEGELMRSPTDAEIASKLGMTLEDYRDLLKSISPIRFFSLSESLNDVRELEIQNNALRVGMKQETIELRTENQELRRVLLNAIQNLPKQERLTIALYYYEEMTMKEIGVVLKVTESRVSQIHTQAILKLRSAVDMAMN